MKTHKADKMKTERTVDYLRSFSSFTEYTQHQINKKINSITRLYQEAEHRSGIERHKIKMVIFALTKEIQEASKSINNDSLQAVA
jgi:hypothetical protein